MESILDFLAGGWKKELGTKEEFEEARSSERSMKTPVIMRVSDLQMAIEDYKMGYFSDEEFQRTVIDLADKVYEAISEVTRRGYLVQTEPF